MELVNDVLQAGLTQAAAAGLHRVSVPTVRKWVSRFRAQGEEGLHDRSSRPKRSPWSIAQTQVQQIVEGRRRYLTQARIAASVAVSKSTVGRVLRRAGLSRLSDLQPAEPPQRYEHELPGDLVYIDTKKLGRIERMGHRITGNPRDNTNGAGWEFLFVAVDDHARIGFTDLYPDERHASAVQFLHNLVAYFASLGVRVQRILTDNGGVFRSKPFKAACHALGLKHKFTRAYRPQTNGKAERFIQSALREWAYGIPYNHSTERAHMLERWIHHYNWHRPHQGIQGRTPMTRLRQSRNNLLTLHRLQSSATPSCSKIGSRPSRLRTRSSRST
jgi:transposase InsO family protein